MTFQIERTVVCVKVYDGGGVRRWTRTDFYCMKCGAQDVYECKQLDEDNAGWQHVCANCGYGMMHPGESYLDADQDIVDQLVQLTTRETVDVT